MSSNADKDAESAETQGYIRRYGVTPEDADKGVLLKMIEDLFSDGLTTQLDPFPDTDREFSALLDELRQLPPNALKEKLIISGWKLSPHGEDQMRCQECMYYLVHRRWCDLPELNLPAEPEWWCRLWRI